MSPNSQATNYINMATPSPTDATHLSDETPEIVGGVLGILLLIVLFVICSACWRKLKTCCCKEPPRQSQRRTTIDYAPLVERTSYN